jgi:prolyl-tRNA editing enzyme YbaK/EbsC (Cys-tRNA(Pro) deacylase)
MIQKAEEKKRQRGDKQIVFWCNDLEHERLTEEPRFSGRTDLIVASFGMGSFVEDTVGMLRRFSQWLRPGGKILLSFYNENSCVLRLTPSWRDTSLASNVNVPGKSLRVRLPNNQTFDIFCKPFNEGTKGDINKIFEIDSLVTYPTVLALLPNSLLKDSIASELFGRVDKALAYAFLPLVPQKLREDPRIVDAARSLERNLRHYGEIGSGHYVIVVAAKPGPAGAGYARALEVLGQQPHDAWQIIQHGAALSLEDVRKELGSEAPPDDAMVKTLVFKERGGRIICVSLAGRRHIDKGWLARFLGMGKNSLRLASERDISLLGFPLGGVAPIGFGKDKIIRRLVDRSVIESHHIWLYTGVGDNRRTLRIKKEVLVALLEGGEVVDLPRLDS